MPLGDLEFASGGFELGDDFWSGGTQLASGVPALTPVGLAGHGYMVDVRKIKSATIPGQRQAVDQAQNPGEGTLNPVGVWTRQMNDWSLGEGQVFQDRPQSDGRRVFKIRGGDWNSKDALAVGQRFEQQESKTGTGQIFAKAGTWYYWYEGTTFKLTQAPTGAFSAWTTITGLTGTPKCIATDGTQVYIGTTTGLFRSTIGTAAQTATAIVTGVDNVGYVQNHLLIGQANVLSELDAAFAATIISTHRSTAFRWNVIAGGNGNIWAGGFAGSVSELFVLTVSQTTGLLQKAVSACSFLPDELIYTMTVYGQKAVIGTSAGARVADIVSMGGLSYGAAVGGSAVRSLVGYDRFVYFGVDAVDGVSGVGRIDLSVAVDPDGNQFSYAVDSLPSATAPTGGVTGIAALTNNEVWGIIEAKGIFHRLPNTSGNWTSGSAVVETGWITFNTIELKTIVDVDAGTVLPTSFDTLTIEFSTDGSTWSTIGVINQISLPPFTVSVNQPRRLKLRFTLTAGVGRANTTAFPTMSYWSLRGMPAPRRARQMVLPLMIATKVMAGAGENQDTGFTNCQAEYDYLYTLLRGGQLQTLQFGNSSYLCKIDDLEQEPVDWADFFAGLSGIVHTTVTIP
jgi:hypothetical protein